MKEIFKEVKGFPNYKISNKGIILSNRANKLVWKELSKRYRGGYRTQTLTCKAQDGKQVQLHRLVVEHFIGDIPEGYEVNHIDGIKDNNIVTNLEIVTPKDNCKHRDRNGHYMSGKSGYINKQGVS